MRRRGVGEGGSDGGVDGCVEEACGGEVEERLHEYMRFDEWVFGKELGERFGICSVTRPFR